MTLNDIETDNRAIYQLRKVDSNEFSTAYRIIYMSVAKEITRQPSLWRLRLLADSVTSVMCPHERN